MTSKKFLKQSIQYRKTLKKQLESSIGRKCGHIGKDQISLDCAVCKSWLTYEFFSWFIDDLIDLNRWEKEQNV